MTVKLQNLWLLVLLFLSAAVGPLLNHLGIWDDLYQTVISWAPLLLASMFLSYRFTRVHSEGESMEFKHTGTLADTASLLLLGLAILSVATQGCALVPTDVYEEYHDKNQGNLTTTDFVADSEYVFACMDYSEFSEIEDEVYGGRYMSISAFFLSDLRVATPVVLLWLYFLSFGKGLTARFFNLKPFLMAAPWSYHLYLLQLPVLRFYWLATRGVSHDRWSPSNVNAPIQWYELPIIIAISVLLGALLQWSVVQFLMGFTSKLGVKVCSFIKDVTVFLTCRNGHAKEAKSTEEFVTDLLATLTGTKVNAGTALADLNLNSLGATSFLSSK